jgi:hypothetical protein
LKVIRPVPLDIDQTKPSSVTRCCQDRCTCWRRALPTARLATRRFAEVEGLDPALPRLTKPFVHSDLAAAVAGLRIGVDPIDGVAQD